MTDSLHREEAIEAEQSPPWGHYHGAHNHTFLLSSPDADLEDGCVNVGAAARLACPCGCAIVLPEPVEAEDRSVVVECPNCGDWHSILWTLEPPNP